MHKQFRIVLNPIAGAGAARRLVDRLARRLRAGGHAVSVFRTRAAGDGRRYAATLSAADADAVLVAGGDGTISEVIDGLVSPAGADPMNHPPLAILPVGTENLLGKLLGIRANVAQAEQTLLHGQHRLFDVPHVGRPADGGDEWDAGSGPRAGLNHFLMIAGAGFDGEVVHRLHRRRAGTITYADYASPIIMTLLSYGFPAIRVEADGREVCREPALVFVGNIPRYALGLPVCANARADDGLLDLVVFRCAHHGQLLLHSLRTMFRLHLHHRDVTYVQARLVVVRAREAVSLEVDGDDCGQLPARFAMPGHQVRLLVPPSRD